jgi:hypothetical protein
MKVSGQLHDPAALTSGKETSIPIVSDIREAHYFLGYNAMKSGKNAPTFQRNVNAAIIRVEK